MGDKTLTLGVSGMLWQDSLVMYDMETNSLWSHLLGEAMKGPLKGEVLKQVPSVMTDFKSWRERYPESTVAVLPRSANAFVQSDLAQDLKLFVLGAAQGDAASAWSLELLQQRPVLNDRFADNPVLVAFDRASLTAQLFSRQVESNPLTFRLDGQNVIDEQTQSVWDPVTGQSTAGRWKGTRLTPLTAVMSYTAAWKSFYPDSKIHTAGEGGQ